MRTGCSPTPRPPCVGWRIETIDEIGRENADYFREAGGEDFTLIPCLNDSDDGMAVLRDRVLKETQGWL
jgi:ferrochelatase